MGHGNVLHVAFSIFQEGSGYKTMGLPFPGQDRAGSDDYRNYVHLISGMLGLTKINECTEMGIPDLLNDWGRGGGG